MRHSDGTEEWRAAPGGVRRHMHVGVEAAEESAAVLHRDAGTGVGMKTKARRRTRRWMPTYSPTTICYWEWVEGRGLYVVYLDGDRRRSAWDSLREFEHALEQEREFAREVRP